MNAENKTLPYGMVKTCRECLKPLGGYERAFFQIYEGHCVNCHNRLTAPSHLNGMHNSAKHGCWYCSQSAAQGVDCHHEVRA